MSLQVLHAQQYTNDFERSIYNYPWTHVAARPDSTSLDSTQQITNHFCLCDSLTEFGFGFEWTTPDSLQHPNLSFHYSANYRYPDTIGNIDLVTSIGREGKTLYWHSYPLNNYSNDSAQWFPVEFTLHVPADYLTGSTFKTYLWNPNKNRVHVDNAQLSITEEPLPSFLPQHPNLTTNLNDLEDSPLLFLKDPQGNPLSYPIQYLTEYIINNDTIIVLDNISNNNQDERYSAFSEFGSISVSFEDQEGETIISVQREHSAEGIKVVREALVIPFIDSTFTVYRRNRHIDTAVYQNEYYLDREGIAVGTGERRTCIYHPTELSSMQFDPKTRCLYLNLDYWRDHPLIHFPLSSDTSDYFVDCSCSTSATSVRKQTFRMKIGEVPETLPRLMPVPYGYESGIIFTEHADWTDIRTHRAVVYGNELAHNAREATGGFVFYGIPVTKSVFYCNPDGVTNEEASDGMFTGLHATIKTDKAFSKLLKQLKREGFDICLHTPEQYTSNAEHLSEALRYMQRQFGSPSWIDHGYNNGMEHNRENLVCDGLTPGQSAYAAGMWRQYGVRYPWNAYYEENRMEQWCFDNNLMQPYGGFGDAIPNRQITTIADAEGEGLLTWSTPATLDANSDWEWDYYYAPQRLQKLVDNHDVHITHTYPAWTNPARAFWTYDLNGTLVALPGFNRALERIAQLRSERKMLPMTIATYLRYYEQLQQVEYHIIDECTIQLVNKGDSIEGLTLLSETPLLVSNTIVDFRKTEEGYLIWFDLKHNESITIEIP